jgi:hypothetical protein
VNSARRKKVAVACAQGVGLALNSQLKLAAYNPMRLVFRVTVRAVMSSGRVAPLEDMEAFRLKPVTKLGRTRLFDSVPTLYP